MPSHTCCGCCHSDIVEEVEETELIYEEAPIESIYRINEDTFEDVLKGNLTEDDFAKLYSACVYTISNFIGAPGQKYQHMPIDLMSFINRFFMINTSERVILAKETASIEHPPFVIIVHLIEALGLTPTDPNGLSDPFCEVWITEDPAKKYRTAVIDNSVDPVWNEKVTIPVTHFQRNKLYVDIWDMDPTGIAAAVGQLKSVKNFRGFLIYCRELMDTCRCWGDANVDDFLGRVTIDLNTIYCEGMDEWLPLQSETGDEGVGEIHIGVLFDVVRPVNYINSLKRHLILCKIFCERGIKELNEASLEKIEIWEEMVPQPALSLLFQHAIQSSISSCEYSLCRWLVVDYLHESGHKLSYSLFYNVLHEAYEEVSSDTNTHVCNCLETFFLQRLTTFNADCYKCLDSLHSSGLLITEQSSKKFEYMLQCIYLLQKILNYDTDPLVVLAQHAIKWYEAEACTVVKKIQSSPEQVSELIVTLLNTFQQCQFNADRVVLKVRPSKSFTQLTYEALWTTICKELKPAIIELIEKASEACDAETKQHSIKQVVEIIFSLSEIWNHAENTSGRSIVECLDSYRTWLQMEVVEEWFQSTEGLIMSTLPESIKEDDFESIESNGAFKKAKISSSAISTIQILEERLFQLWSMLVWPGSNIDMFFSESLYHCCLKYTSLLLEETDKRNLYIKYDEDGKKKLAVIANNLWTLSEFTDLTKTGIHTGPPSCPDTKTELRRLCAELCANISEHRHAVITTLINHIPIAATKQRQEAAIGTYEAYVARLIWNEACVDLRFETFVLFVKEIWNHVVSTIADLKNIYKIKKCRFLKRVCGKLCRRANVYRGLLSTLIKTEKLVHDERDCLPRKLMQTDLYLKTRDDLTILAK